MLGIESMSTLTENKYHFLFFSDQPFVADRSQNRIMDIKIGSFLEILVLWESCSYISPKQTNKQTGIEITGHPYANIVIIGYAYVNVSMIFVSACFFRRLLLKARNKHPAWIHSWRRNVVLPLVDWRWLVQSRVGFTPLLPFQDGNLLLESV